MFPKIIAIESFPADRATAPMSVVLRDFGPNKHDRYVTHCRNDNDGSFFWGHYYTDEAIARKDFTDRCARYRKQGGA
jgi:uncharacterized protein YcgI (DUF1989 family)